MVEANGRHTLDVNKLKLIVPVSILAGFLIGVFTMGKMVENRDQRLTNVERDLSEAIAKAEITHQNLEQALFNLRLEVTRLQTLSDAVLTELRR